MNRLTFTLVLSLLVLDASVGRASPEVAEELVIHSGSSLYDDQVCGFCHVGGIRDIGSVRTSFGEAMLARGLSPEFMSSVDTAFDALRAQGVDSDLDGVPDATEVTNGLDPNVPNTAAAAPVQFGCAVGTDSAIPQGASTSLTIVGALVLGLAFRRRRTR